MNRQKPPHGIEWKSIPGYESIYDVSLNGEVRRLGGTPKCCRTRILKLQTRTNGYKFVCLSKNGQVRQVDVHRLVAWAFHGPQGGKWVSHESNVKSENVLGNLEYLTPGQNTAKAYRDGLMPPKRGEGNPHSKATNETVVAVRLAFNSGISRQEICRRFNLSKTTIRDIVTRHSWKHLP
jgi:hypothetical protein